MVNPMSIERFIGEWTPALNQLVTVVDRINSQNASITEIIRKIKGFVDPTNANPAIELEIEMMRTKIASLQEQIDISKNENAALRMDNLNLRNAENKDMRNQNFELRKENDKLRNDNYRLKSKHELLVAHTQQAPLRTNIDLSEVTTGYFSKDKESDIVAHHTHEEVINLRRKSRWNGFIAEVLNIESRRQLMQLCYDDFRNNRKKLTHALVNKIVMWEAIKRGYKRKELDQMATYEVRRFATDLHYMILDCDGAAQNLSNSLGRGFNKMTTYNKKPKEKQSKKEGDSTYDEQDSETTDEQD